jgi:hypothetical protein
MNKNIGVAKEQEVSVLEQIQYTTGAAYGLKTREVVGAAIGGLLGGTAALSVAIALPVVPLLWGAYDMTCKGMNVGAKAGLMSANMLKK